MAIQQPLLPSVNGALQQPLVSHDILRYGTEDTEEGTDGEDEESETEDFLAQVRQHSSAAHILSLTIQRSCK